MSANYINVIFAEESGIFQYLVRFDPDIDSRSLRRDLLNQHKDKWDGVINVFDGSLMYLPRKYLDGVSSFRVRVENKT